jgi:uncharacterized protein YfdQ (DUF2303 family)
MYTHSVDAAGGPVDTGQITIPEKFKLLLPVFEGIDAGKYEMEARFRFDTKTGSLKLRYELVRPHKVVERAFKDLLAMIQTETGKMVLFGDPDGDE